MSNLSQESKKKRYADICAKINNGKFGGKSGDVALWLGDSNSKSLSVDRFPSGCAELDDALGGGWPKARHIELYGPESGGKTTLAYHAIAEYQKKYPDEPVVFIDTEYTFDPDYAANVGVQTDWLIAIQPSDGIQALNVMYEFIQNGAGLIVLDSVAALVTAEDMENDLGDVQVATQARLMSVAMRKINTATGQAGTTIIWTNQLREKIGVSYGDNTTTPAGRALKHYAAVRASVRKISAGEKEKKGTEEIVVSNKVQVDIKKNKVAPPYRKANFFITFGFGIDKAAAILDGALARNVIYKKKKGSSWFSFKDRENIANGRSALLEMIRSSSDFYDEVVAEMDNPSTPVVAVVEEELGESKVTIRRPKGEKREVRAVEDEPESEDVDVQDV